MVSKIFRHLQSLTVAGAGFLAASSACAGFVGSSIHAQYYYPNLATPAFYTADAVVGAGTEFGLNGRTWDLTDSQVVTNFTITGDFVDAVFNGIVFSDILDNLDSIIGVTVDDATNLAGFSASNVGFDSNSISINYTTNGDGLSFTRDSRVVLNVQFAQSTPVPEPSTLLLVGAALVAAAGLRRSHKPV